VELALGHPFHQNLTAVNPDVDLRVIGLGQRAHRTLYRHAVPEDLYFDTRRDGYWFSADPGLGTLG
jgi:hypothetical protein